MSRFPVLLASVAGFVILRATMAAQDPTEANRMNASEHESYGESLQRQARQGAGETGVRTASTTAKGQCSGRFPLPLATHWTPHSWKSESTTPSWQLDQIKNGHHWLLTLWWGDFEPWTSEAEAYYEPAVAEAQRRKLPIALVSTQWESILYDRGPWKDLPLQQSPLAFDLQGRRTGRLSPIGAVKPWAEAGEAWAEAPVLKRLQHLYPDPPYVVLISNNEARRVKQKDLEKTLRYRRLYGSRKDGQARRQIIGDGYIERYSAMVESLRAHLGAWRESAIIIGWAGGNSNFGRRGWLEQNNPDFGMSVPGRLNIAPFIWDGIAAKYYIDSTVRRTSDDVTLFSPKVQIMNLPLEVAFACKQKHDYYLELTTWFNDEFVEKLRALGRETLAARFGGYVRFGMWIARPRAVRHFSRRKETLSDIGVFLGETMRAVDEVHIDPVLASFWQVGELVVNPDRQNPNRFEIPVEYQRVSRWIALDTNLDPPNPWHIDDILPVWVLALVKEDQGRRQWLVFAQAPLGNRSRVDARVPGLGTVSLRATQRGCYYLVEDRGRTARSVSINEEFCRLPGSS